MAEVQAVNSEVAPDGPDQARQTLALAKEFAAAASVLRAHVRRGDPSSHAPFRFACLHAIELYLCAFLRFREYDHADIRKTGHQFCLKAALALDRGLVLRTKTLGHLVELSGRREYLHARYDPAALAPASQVNRLEATLDEIGRKVCAALGTE